MKMLKLLLLSFLFSLTQVSLAENYVDLFNLSGYAEGDIPTHLLGEKITVRQEVKDGKVIKFVSGQASDGKINYNVPNLAKDFEVIFEFSNQARDILISFATIDKEAKFTFQWDCRYPKLGNNPEPNPYTNVCPSKLATQTLKLKVENGSVKTYIELV